jgi:hypothetical protein
MAFKPAPKTGAYLLHRTALFTGTDTTLFTRHNKTHWQKPANIHIATSMATGNLT